jgi:hypothetical protein
MASDNVAILFIAILLDCGIVRLQSSSGLGSSFDLDVFAGVLSVRYVRQSGTIHTRLTTTFGVSDSITNIGNKRPGINIVEPRAHKTLRVAPLALLGNLYT